MTGESGSRIRVAKAIALAAVQAAGYLVALRLLAPADSPEFLALKTVAVTGTALSVLYQCTGTRPGVDVAFLPRPHRLGQVAGVKQGGLTLALGGLCLLAYSTWAILTPQSTGSWWPYAPIALPRSVSLVLLAAWGFAWVADALTRPRRATFGPAVAWLATCLLLMWWTVADGVLNV